MHRSMLPMFILSLTLPLAACSDYRETNEDRGTRTSEDQAMYPTDAEGAIRRFREADPTIQRFFDNSYAYVVFPKVAKGGAGVGAAHGYGEVFEQGRFVGTAELTQVTVGLQLGGQTYSEIIFFQDPAHFHVFTDGNLEFSANASAIAVREGAAATNDFSEGLAVFVLPRGGLMFEASIGGQKFDFKPRR